MDATLWYMPASHRSSVAEFGVGQSHPSSEHKNLDTIKYQAVPHYQKKGIYFLFTNFEIGQG